jgi:type III restriction enzyme
MRDKESLLTFPSADDDDETRAKKLVSFIFSHTALREGWDSPNVFQICTLNHAVSPMRKRQEVGRGVRLAVNQAGERVFDERVNVLTVVANESYEKYIVTLQSEIADEYRAEIEARYGKPVGDLSPEERLRIAQEYGPDILPPPPARADRPSARLQKARVESPEFRELWNRIRHRTWYHVTVDTAKLLDEVIPELNRRTIEPPRVTIAEAMARVKEVGGFEAIATTATRTAQVLATAERPNLLAVMAELLAHTTPRVHLTRRTLLEVIKRIAKPEVLTANPYEFARVAVGIIKEKVIRQLVAGFRYEKIRDEWWEMQRISDEATRELFSRYTEPSPRAGLYDRMDCDSQVEQRFVRAMEARTDVRFYMKLPAWFEVTTPVGPYRPDWAVVMENPDGGAPLLYLVAETKGGTDVAGLRSKEALKIECARAHFGSRARNTRGALDGVDYGVVTEAAQLPNSMS